MSPALRIRSEAESDLAEAYRWYAAQAAGLADEFLAEVSRALAAIQEGPVLYPKVHKDVRRALTRRFPIGIFFVEESDSIVVLAVMHQARDPDRWKERT